MAAAIVQVGLYHKMKKLYFFSILILVILMMAITCPDKQAHREALTGVVSNTIDDKLSSSLSADSQGWAVLGSIVASKVVESVVDTKLNVKNYFVFSLGRIHWKGEDKVVSLGLLGHIYTFSEDDLRAAVDEARGKHKEKSSLGEKLLDLII